jgi:hypothetical protein
MIEHWLLAIDWGNDRWRREREYDIGTPALSRAIIGSWSEGFVFGWKAQPEAVEKCRRRPADLGWISPGGLINNQDHID